MFEDQGGWGRDRSSVRSTGWAVSTARAMAALVLVAACGPPPPTQSAMQWEEPPARRAPSVTIGEPADFPAVPLPSAYWLRIRTPNRDLPAVASLGIAPPRARPLLLSPRFAVDRALGTLVANAVDMASPIDFLISSDKRSPWISASLSVKSGLDVAVFAPAAPRKVGPGRFRLRTLVDGRKTALTCDLVFATNVPNPRIVCSTFAYRLEGDTAFLVGTAPRITTTDQFHAEFPLEPFREDVTKSIERDIGSSPLRRALMAPLMQEFFAEQRGLGVALSISDRGVDISFDMNFASMQSLYAGWFAGRVWSAGPPASFWQLPGDADLAFGKSGPESATDGTSGFDGLLRKLEATAFFRAMSEANRGVLIDLLRAISPYDADVVYAFGQDRAVVARALDATLGTDVSPAAFDQLKRALHGWALVGIGRNPASFVAAVQNMVRADAKSRTHSPPRRGSFELSPSATVPPDLPAGSLHYVVLQGDAEVWLPGVHEPERTHLFVVPDRGSVWLSLSADENVAARRVSDAVRTDPTFRAAQPELADRPAQNLSAIGLFSIAGIVSLGLEARTASERAIAQRRLSLVSALEHGGNRRVPCWAETVTGTSGTVVRLTARFSREAIAEFFPVLRDWNSEAPEPAF
jgi:hypothetical protein